MYKRYQVDFEHPIRQIQHNNDPSLLGIAVSQPDLSSFYLYDLDIQEISHALNVTEDKGLVLRHFDRDGVLLQKFSEEQNPNLVDILYFQWETDEPFTYLPSMELVEVQSQFVIVKHPRIENRTITLDVKTGEEADGIPQTSILPTLNFPTSYDQENKYFEWFQKLFKPFNIVPIMACEHLLWQEHHWVSAYLKQGLFLENKLYMLNKDGQVLESFLLGDNLKGIGKDTFFATENRLIFVSEHQQLHVLDF